MAITRESNGTWTVQCYYKDWTGLQKRKRKKGFRTKHEAAEWERSFLAKGAPISLTLEEFTEVYLEDKKKSLKERTLIMKRHIIQTHLLPFLGSRTISSITAADLIQWQNAMLEKNYSQTYLRTIQNQLTALFTHASRIYNLQDNPCKKITKIGKSTAGKLNFWTKEDYDLFIRQLVPGSRYYVLFETLFWTGIREGELLALTKNDIDFQESQIHITKTYYRRNHTDFITPPKTEQSIRVVDIPEFLCAELREYIDSLKNLKEDDRIFPIVAEAIQHKLAREIKKGGLKKIRVHDLRHSHVAYLIYRGVQPYIIKERLGHQDIRITMNIYGHLYPSQQKQLAQMLNETR